MPDTKSAQDRLEAALARIEAAAKLLGRAGGDGGDSAAEIAALQSERDALSRAAAALQDENQRLTRELVEVKADHARLQTTANQISGRLDGAIDRLESVLKH